MLKNDLIILYVKNTTLSTAFYTKLLGKDAFDSSENFACIALNESTTLGLWSVKYCVKVDQGIGELWCKSAPPRLLINSPFFYGDFLGCFAWKPYLK